MLADSYLSRGLMDKAMEEFGALSARYPNDFPIKKATSLLILRNRMDEAVQLNDGILKKAPQDSEALVLKGQILLRQNKFDDALTTCKLQ